MRYQPRALDPPRMEREFKARSLNDPGLRAFAAKTEWPPARLDAEALTLAALYFNADLNIARARVGGAEAAVESARPRLNPSIALGGGWTNSPESPLVLHIEPALTLETAGKRALRILAAEKRAEVARLELAQTEWMVRSRVRSAWRSHVFARRALDLAVHEREIRTESVEILEKRLGAGDISRPDVDLARGELIAAEVAAKSAAGAVSESLASLAAVVGLPVASLAAFDPGDVGEPPAPASLPEPVVLQRADVRRALAEYAATETELRLQIAKQYPDIVLTPGYGFDEGHHKIEIGPGFNIPVWNRNRGPIAEAGARREEAAARFHAVQAQAIGEVEKARSGYEAALAELAEARRQIALAGARENAMRRLLAAGEEDRLALTGARVQGAVAARAGLEALRKAHAALGGVEDAAQLALGSH